MHLFKKALFRVSQNRINALYIDLNRNKKKKITQLVPRKSLAPLALFKKIVATSIFLHSLCVHYFKWWTVGIAGSTLIPDVARWAVLQMAILGMRSCIGGRNGRWRWLTSVIGDSTSLLLWEWGTRLMWRTLSQVRPDTLSYSQISLGMFSFHFIRMGSTFRGICNPDDLFRPESEDGLLHHPDLHPLQHDRGAVLGLLLDQQGCRPSPNISRCDN